jgi:hypothetical protein
MEFRDFGQATVNAMIFILFFETYCEDAPCNRLRGSINFVFFGLTDQKLWAAKNTFFKKLLGVGFFSVNS